jgi:hypothetical protein
LAKLAACCDAVHLSELQHRDEPIDTIYRYILYVFLDMLEEARAVKISFSLQDWVWLRYVIILQGHFDSDGGSARFSLPAMLQEDVLLFDVFVRPSTWLILR